MTPFSVSTAGLFMFIKPLIILVGAQKKKILKMTNFYNQILVVKFVIKILIKNASINVIRFVIMEIVVNVRFILKFNVTVEKRFLKECVNP